MMNLTIYFKTNPNFMQSRGTVNLTEFTKVAVIRAEHEEHAYMLAQNLNEPWIQNTETVVEAFSGPCRSMSVGDVVEFNGKFIEVSSIGYQSVVTHWL